MIAVPGGRRLTQTFRISVNGRVRDVAAAPDEPLLWVLREQLKLTGTKFGCGVAMCGACTVLLDGKPRTTCTLAISAVGQGKITTIEGLSAERSHPVQKAWVEEQVPQCGYCQSGMILSAVALLAEKPQPTDADIDAAMTHICRCGTYPRIRAAIHRAAGARKA